jgi:Rad3-related DNA helicase
VLEQFKTRGGIWIASGCAEGIDLPGDLCRVNIIPILLYSNPYSPLVKKQLALPLGHLKYELHTIKIFIQQCGRSTRNESDYSTIYVGDTRLPGLIAKNIKYIPESFVKSIKWSLK